MTSKTVPTPTDELKTRCKADNQLIDFERLFGKVMSVPKAEVLERKTKENLATLGRAAKKERR